MAQVVVLADPPREGLVLPEVPETSALTLADATDLYAGFLRDTVVAAEDSGGELLVNYRPDELLPEQFRRDLDSESAMRAAVDSALAAPGEARFEEQVGSTRSARVGNTVTHLLEEEDASSVVVVDPRAPTLGRTGIDEMQMKLRRSDVVVVPSTRGRVAAVGFGAAIDFDEALTAPALTRVVQRALDAGLEANFTAVEPLVETAADLVSVVSLTEARVGAGRSHPEFTAGAVDELELQLGAMDGGVAVLPGTDSS
jgi:2-phospho-L-lactate guanylyltransferase (CobY/MobA/RfbA family)